MSETTNPLTDEVKALIGASAEKVEASPPWGIEREGLRIFTELARVDHGAPTTCSSPLADARAMTTTDNPG